jgi:N6-L-threonylcarbamoyladenine synthase
VLGGGVAANKELRKQFIYKLKTINYKLNFLVAPKNLCTDNGAMIAVAGYATWLRQGYTRHKNIEADPNLSL